MTQRKHRRAQWQDHYTRRAQRERYPARSVYKLQEMQTRFRLVRRGDRVLDLGCAPGAWLLYAAEQTGPRGRVTGMDLTPVTISLPAQAEALMGDVRDLALDPQARVGSGFEVVLSDMAPATTGNKHVDVARCLELARTALAVADALLVPGGHFVCKLFQGADVDDFIGGARTRFARLRLFKPQSSRKPSKEIYLIGFDRNRR